MAAASPLAGVWVALPMSGGSGSVAGAIVAAMAAAAAAKSCMRRQRGRGLAAAMVAALQVARLRDGEGGGRGDDGVDGAGGV